MYRIGCCILAMFLYVALLMAAGSSSDDAADLGASAIFPWQA
jgi:hypothetical protein